MSVVHERVLRTIRESKATGEARAAAEGRKKFLRFFPGGFYDETYLDWEREYKMEAHKHWEEVLGEERFAKLIKQRKFMEVAATAIRVEQRVRHPMLFSFEKMALRDAVRSPGGAKIFARGLFEFLHGKGSMQERFEAWAAAVGKLPRKQTRVLTWPMVSVWGFMAQPEVHLFVKPKTVRAAARNYGFNLDYRSRPNWETYRSVLAFAEQIRRDLSGHGRELRARDMVDLQSFIWVMGSGEYEE